MSKLEKPTLKTEAQSSISSSVYHKIRADILDGKLVPGDKLGMVALQERYDTGNTPIREALSRLVPEGLVLREEQKGFRVQSLQLSDLAEITQTRCWLENIAIRESIKHGDTHWEENIVLAYHRLSRTPRFLDQQNQTPNIDWEIRHMEFHMSLLAGFESKWLTFYCMQLYTMSERYIRAALTANKIKRESKNEHLAIMNAAIDRDADQCSILILEHIQKTSQRIMPFLPA